MEYILARIDCAHFFANGKKKKINKSDESFIGDSIFGFEIILMEK